MLPTPSDAGFVDQSVYRNDLTKLMADDLVTVALIELVRRMIGDVGIQHQGFTVLPVRVALYPIHELLTDAPPSILRVDDHVVDIQIASTPETRSQPDARHTDTAIIRKSGNALISLCDHILKSLRKHLRRHARIECLYQR